MSVEKITRRCLSQTGGIQCRNTAALTRVIVLSKPGDKWPWLASIPLYVDLCPQHFAEWRAESFAPEKP